MPVQAEIHVSPSGLERAMECTGFPVLAEGIPKAPQSQHAALGTKAHKAVLEDVRTGDPGATVLGDGFEDVDFETTEKWTRHAEYLLGLAYNRVKGSEIMLERKLPALQELGMVPSGREGEHQADMVWVTSNRWNVLDYKSGKGAIEVKDNRQLMAYAWAVMKEEGLLQSQETVTLWIYQPELGKDATSWDVPMELLRAFGKEAAAKILEAEEGGQLKEGPWCTYCPVGDAGACPLVGGKKDRRSDVVTLAKAEAAELAQALERDISMKESMALSLPESAADIVIPLAVKQKVDALIAKEAAILAVDRGNVEEVAGLLKEIGLVADKWEDAEAMAKWPYAQAKKAVEDAFDPGEKGLAAAKLSLKAKYNNHLAIEERKRQAIIAQQKAEQDKIARDLAEAAAKAEKAKGAKKAELEAEAQKLREQQAVASVRRDPPPAPKVAGIAVAEVWTFDIPDVTKIPARYLIQHQGMLTITGSKAVVILEVDGKVLTADAKAGRLEKSDWLKATKSSGASAR
jgi:hypothetical protein